MAVSKSSKRWLDEHFDDEYVKRSREDGYRSRAVYKLIEMNQKQKLIRKGMNILDLGAAPGGWSQYCAEINGDTGKVIATDILPVDPMANVEFIQGDFREDDVLETLLAVTGDEKYDVVISDMAPNISGVDCVDQPKSIYLCELALDMAVRTLKSDGAFVVKLFQGAGSDEYIKEVRQHFKTTKILKPKASRQRSREVYILGKGFVV